MGKNAVRYPELVSMIRLLYAEVAAHGDDYHHVTPPERIAHVKEFLIAVDGRLPGPARPENQSEAEDDDQRATLSVALAHNLLSSADPEGGQFP